MTEWLVEVYIPSLVSRGSIFQRHEDGTLFLSRAELLAELVRRPGWPLEATVVAPETMRLGGEVDGSTFRDGQEREVVHGRRIGFVLSSPSLPPSGFWRPWELKSTKLLDDGARPVR